MERHHSGFEDQDQETLHVLVVVKGKRADKHEGDKVFARPYDVRQTTNQWVDLGT
jgi:hypothetical protein